jgi:hypothetical protein
MAATSRLRREPPRPGEIPRKWCETKAIQAGRLACHESMKYKPDGTETHARRAWNGRAGWRSRVSGKVRETEGASGRAAMIYSERGPPFAGQ